MSASSTNSPRVLPGWQQALFSLIICSVFFMSLELILALFGGEPELVKKDPYVDFAGSIPLFEKITRPDGSTVWQTDHIKLESFNFQKFPVTKSANTYRIFSMGGSTTVGRPYNDKISFSRWLREFLPAADPSKNWEVINAGGISYASYRVAALMEELVQYEPDLFIIYSGHNEFLEERTYRQIKKLPRPLIKLTAILNRTRTFSGLKKLYDSLQSKAPEDQEGPFLLDDHVNEILAKSIGPTDYHRDDTLRQNIIDHYRFNLDRMIDIAQAANAAILFVVPPANLKDMSPFKSEHPAPLTPAAIGQFDRFFTEGDTLIEAGKPDEALAAYRMAHEIDPRYADLLYRMGQASLALKDYGTAGAFFQKANDEDICPLRILSTMEQAVTDVAADRSIPLVNFRTVLEQDALHRYGYGLLGNEYFLDHVHISIDSHKHLALVLLDEMAASGILSPSVGWQKKNIAAITRQVTSELDPQSQAMALANLGQVIGWSGKHEEAHDILKQAEKLAPRDGFVLSELGKSFNRLGYTELAIAYFQMAIDAEPGNSRYHSFIAHALQAAERPDEAYYHYQKMLSYSDPDADIKLDLQAIEMAIRFARQGQTDKALFLLEEANSQFPGYPGILFNLARVYEDLNNFAKAMLYYEQLLKVSPEDAQGHNNLGAIYARTGNVPKAEVHFEKALKIKPDYPEAHFNLALALESQGDQTGAEYHFGESVKYAEQNPDRSDQGNSSPESD